MEFIKKNKINFILLAISIIGILLASLLKFNGIICLFLIMFVFAISYNNNDNKFKVLSKSHKISLITLLIINIILGIIIMIFNSLVVRLYLVSYNIVIFLVFLLTLWSIPCFMLFYKLKYNQKFNLLQIIKDNKIYLISLVILIIIAFIFVFRI